MNPEPGQGRWLDHGETDKEASMSDSGRQTGECRHGTEGYVTVGCVLCERDALKAECDALRADLAAAVDALQELHDEQNGVPLIRRQRQWEDAMEKASLVLAKRG